MNAARWQRPYKGLSLLLCCRQIYVYFQCALELVHEYNSDVRRRYLEGLPILYSTTLVFAQPRDLYNLQLCVCPEGLASIKRLVVAFGAVTRPLEGPLLSSGWPEHADPGSL